MKFSIVLFFIASKSVDAFVTETSATDGDLSALIDSVFHQSSPDAFVTKASTTDGDLSALIDSVFHQSSPDAFVTKASTTDGDLSALIDSVFHQSSPDTLVTQAGAVDDSNLTAILDAIFASSSPGETVTTPGTVVAGGAVVTGVGADTCECVPYYLCNDNNENSTYGTIDGIDLHIQPDNDQCEDYLSVCCKTRTIITEPRPPERAANKSNGCGVRNEYGVGFHITGDIATEAEFGEFPWMVGVLSVENNDGKNLNIYKCGGSLIHPQVVLTSAHCVIDNEKKFIIRAGEWDTQTKNELYAHQDRNVSAVVTHPDYNSKDGVNDIALLILDTPVDIIDNVDTVCLPSKAKPVNPKKCFDIGWAGNNGLVGKTKYEPILSNYELPIVANDVCQESLRKTSLGSSFVLHNSFICAGGDVGNEICTGGKGGPLICPIEEHPGKYYQAGIVSWGISCKEPVVYTNVNLYSDWIDEQMANRGFDKSHYTD